METKLIFGDCLELMKELPDMSIDAVVTDYVYGTEFPLNILRRICKGNIITFCASEDEPFVPTERAYWIKTPSTKNYIKRLGRFVEKIYIYRQGDVFNKLHWSQMTGVYDDRVIESEGHPWRKPLTLVERLIRIYTNAGDIVLDPFMGGGSVGLACKNLDRNFMGMEILLDSFIVAQKRLL